MNDSDFIDNLKGLVERDRVVIISREFLRTFCKFIYEMNYTDRNAHDYFMKYYENFQTFMENETNRIFKELQK